MWRGSGLCFLALSLLSVCNLPSQASALGQAPNIHPAPQRTLLQSTSNAGDCCARLEAIGFNSTLPVVLLDSSGQLIPHHVNTFITLCTCSKNSSIQDFYGPARAAGRGSSSAKFDKKSFKFRTLGEDGKGIDFPILGMPEEEDWILYGPEEDKTLGMRNYLAYNLARASGRYATRTVYAEVFLLDDGRELSMEHYNGVYIVQERVKRGKDRVNIKKLRPKNLSGGYIFNYDNNNYDDDEITIGPLEGFAHPFVLKYRKKHRTRRQPNRYMAL
ncbi:hypothetical protein KSW81_001763 [Nannochloris sp. 'desiccata']|nr:hypothetical protein KSW81_001763 [Chlorella desiccata (nom. nud.)]